MCGIAAIFSTRFEEGVSSQVQRMLDKAAHRGPDGRGMILGRGSTVVPGTSDVPADWALGHVRLAILDLSPAGLQPMSYDNGRLWICYNGEVYNYLELREKLSREGYEFRSTTDTEVILAAYSHWGDDCVKRFIGMFAFVIVDLVRQKVLLARDRVGVKPLYLWQDSHSLFIVSEPKQLLAVRGFQARCHRQQAVDYLVEETLGHEPNLCFFDGVHPLPPGHTLTWHLGELPSLSAALRYWTPSLMANPMTWEEAVHETGRLFRRAVELRLRSDVPVGSCLSGGVDSSSIVGMATRGLGTSFNTFSVCSTHPAFDEQEYIDVVNRHCGTTPHKVFLEQENASEELDEVVYVQDEPFPGLSVYAQWLLMREARRFGVPVLLDGQGGDEALCGYRKFAYFYLGELLAGRRYAEAAALAAKLILRGDGRLFEFRSGQRYLPNWLGFLQDDIAGLLTNGWRELVRRPWAEKMGNVKRLREHQIADFTFWSLPGLLRFEDRNSMAHGIETRLPFVDHNFLEHCLSLPESFFFHRGKTKRLLTQSIGGALPREVHARKTKSHFGTSQPILMQGSLGHFLESRIRGSERLATILDTSRIVEDFRIYRARKRPDADGALFRIASFAMWLDRFEVDV